MFAITAGLYSCGNKSDNGESDSATVNQDSAYTADVEDSAEEIQPTVQEEPVNETEEGIYRPPFKVTVLREYRDGGWKYKDKYVFSILNNGRLSGSWESLRRDAYDRGDWEEWTPKEEFGGKWSTSSISMGDSYLDVYAIDRSDRETTIYLPATCDYIWMCDYAWLECENWNTDKAMKVTSVEKL